VNRVSLGVQSFVDQEAASVGRIHTGATVHDNIARLRASGISNINVDLIAGLPHQTHESWDYSMRQATASGVPHVSIYMLEVDEDSRLGREVLAGGTKYHAHFVPDDDLTADFYLQACEKLHSSGVAQYEISNFARPGLESRHNLKYWTRQPYVGFGVDAHSMLFTGGAEDGLGASSCGVRFSAPDSLDAFLRGDNLCQTRVSREAALEETFFLGLRLNRGVDLAKVQELFGPDSLTPFAPVIAELNGEGLIEQASEMIRLTSRGRLLSNEVFERFLSAGEARAAAKG
jgi:oxygen-independent coproporphyrinogen-3 oxidase